MYNPSYQPVAEALHVTLAREGVHVGDTAAYPRVECHSFVENTPQDKGDAVRVLACVVESMSVTSPEEAAGMNADNLALIQTLDGYIYTSGTTTFEVIGIVPTQFQDMTETSDPQKILYRALQSIDIYVQQI